MTTIERAARALVSWELGLSDHATNQTRYGANLDERYAEVERRWPDKVEQVRIVLASIRRPSKAMGDAGWGEAVHGAHPPEVFTAIIDAALAEGA